MLFGEEPAESGPPSKRRAVGNRKQGSSVGGSHQLEPKQKGDAPSWGALAEVYAQLGQDDLVQVIYAKCLSRSALIKCMTTLLQSAARQDMLPILFEHEMPCLNFLHGRSA